MFLRANVLCRQHAQTSITKQAAMVIASPAACPAVIPVFWAWALTWSGSRQFVFAKSMTYPFLSWLWSRTISPYSSYFCVCKLSMKLQTVSSLFSWLEDYKNRRKKYGSVSHQNVWALIKRSWNTFVHLRQKSIGTSWRKSNRCWWR